MKADKIRAQIESSCTAAARDWYRRACGDPYRVYYLFYKPASGDDPLFWSPIIDKDDPGPGEDWIKDIPVATNLTTGDVAKLCTDRMCKLPLLNIDKAY